MNRQAEAQSEDRGVLGSKLGKRVFFGTAMVALLAGLLLADGYLSTRNYFARDRQVDAVIFVALAALLAAAGAVELVRLAQLRGLRPPTGVMMVGAAAVATQPWWAEWGGAASYTELMPLLLLAILGAAGLWQGWRYRTENALGNLAVVMLGVIYLGLGCWFAVRIRLWGAGSGSLVSQVGPVAMFLMTVKSCDIGAYLIGRKLGRHAWVPSISPAKTWEGLIGGLVVAGAVGSIFAVVLGIMSWWAGLGYGLVVGAVGQLGDLLESLWKRDAGAKDSAALVPEFGGCLDLLDSILAAAPAAYLWLTMFGRFS